MAQYLKRGQETALSGYLKQDRWQAPDGSNRSRVVLMVESLKLLGGNKNNDQAGNYNDQAGNYGDANGAFNSGFYGA